MKRVKAKAGIGLLFKGEGTRLFMVKSIMVISPA